MKQVPEPKDEKPKEKGVKVVNQGFEEFAKKEIERTKDRE